MKQIIRLTENDLHRMVEESVQKVLSEKSIQHWLRWFLDNSRQGRMSSSEENILSALKSISNEGLWYICHEYPLEYNYLYDIFDENDIDPEEDYEKAGYYVRMAVLEEFSDISQYIDQNNNLIISRDITIDKNKFNFDDCNGIGSYWAYGDNAWAYGGDQHSPTTQMSIIRLTGRVNLDNIDLPNTIALSVNFGEKEIRIYGEVEINQIEVIDVPNNNLSMTSHAINRRIIWKGERLMETSFY
jgi:hypothetical protein